MKKLYFNYRYGTLSDMGITDEVADLIKKIGKLKKGENAYVYVSTEKFKGSRALILEAVTYSYLWADYSVRYNRKIYIADLCQRKLKEIFNGKIPEKIYFKIE